MRSVLNYSRLILFTLFAAFTNYSFSAADYTTKSEGMLAEIQSDARLTSFATGIPVFSQQVMDAMRKIPRHKFVRPQDQKFAYENRPLSIGYGQTISQPYIVALMTELLGLGANHKVLEVGTGSGYQAAILGNLSKSVYSIEIIEPLAKQAQNRLSELGYHNIKVRVGDGYFGWPQEAPFDAIIITAASSHVPPPLIEQLKPGGKMVIPVGSQFFTQQLMLIEKFNDGSIHSRQILPVSFVPLTGAH